MISIDGGYSDIYVHESRKFGCVCLRELGKQPHDAGR
jgi:hypothetical protein